MPHFVGVANFRNFSPHNFHLRALKRFFNGGTPRFGEKKGFKSHIGAQFSFKGENINRGKNDKGETPFHQGNIIGRDFWGHPL